MKELMNCFCGKSVPANRTRFHVTCSAKCSAETMGDKRAEAQMLAEGSEWNKAIMRAREFKQAIEILSGE